MKKYYLHSLMSRGVLGLSALFMLLGFAACNSRSEAEYAPFAITIADTTSTSARILIHPADTTAAYYWNLFVSGKVQGMSDDSLRMVLAADLQDWLSSIVWGSNPDCTVADLLSRGTTDEVYPDLTANTAYTALVVKMNEEGQPDGKVARASFRTLPVQADSVVTLEPAKATLQDLRTQDGTFLIIANYKVPDLEIRICMDTQSPEGQFGIDDLDPAASYITDWTAYKSYNIIDAAFSGTRDGDTIVYAGWFITQNRIKYLFRFTVQC